MESDELLEEGDHLFPDADPEPDALELAEGEDGEEVRKADLGLRLGAHRAPSSRAERTGISRPRGRPRFGRSRVRSPST